MMHSVDATTNCEKDCFIAPTIFLGIFLKILGLHDHYWCSKFKRNQHMRSNITEFYQG